MDKYEALELLIGYANAFANNSLWGKDAGIVLSHIADAAEVLRTELAPSEAEVGSFEI